MVELFVAVSAKGGPAWWAWRAARDREPVGEGVAAVPAPNTYAAELSALCDALEALPQGPVALHSAQENFRRTVAEWMPRWRDAGWRRSGGPIPHLELWQRVARAIEARPLTVAPLPTGHADANAARRLARDAAAGAVPLEVPTSEATVLVYTDGGCRGNPGPGGWGFTMTHAPTGAVLEARGGEAETTNNRMEMRAAIEALEALTRPGQDVEIRSDSSYLIELASRWLPAWKRRGWTRNEGQPIANLDLVQRLDGLLASHRVRWTKVPGHAGEPGNERADALANEAMDALAAGEDPARRVRRTPDRPRSAR